MTLTTDLDPLRYPRAGHFRSRQPVSQRPLMYPMCSGGGSFTCDSRIYVSHTDSPDSHFAFLQIHRLQLARTLLTPSLETMSTRLSIRTTGSKPSSTVSDVFQVSRRYAPSNDTTSHPDTQSQNFRRVRGSGDAWDRDSFAACSMAAELLLGSVVELSKDGAAIVLLWPDVRAGTAMSRGKKERRPSIWTSMSRCAQLLITCNPCATLELWLRKVSFGRL